MNETNETTETPEFDVKYYNKRARGIVDRLSPQNLSRSIVMLATKGGILEYIINDKQEVSDLKIVKVLHNGMTKHYGEKKVEVTLIANPDVIKELAIQVPDSEFTTGLTKAKPVADMSKIVKEHIIDLHSNQNLDAEIIASTSFVATYYNLEEVKSIIEDYKISMIEEDVNRPALQPEVPSTLDEAPLEIDSDGIVSPLPLENTNTVELPF